MNMKQRKNPTLTQHAEIAHDIRSAEIALGKVLNHSRFFYARETDALIRARERTLSRLKSRLEDVMFADYPHLSNDWLRLYYGDHADIAKLSRWQGVDVTALVDDLRGCGALDEEQERMRPIDLLDDLYGAGSLDDGLLAEYLL